MEFRGVIGVGADVGLEVHVAVGVVREAEVRAAVERRVIEPIEVVLIGVLGQALVVVLALGEVAGSVLEVTQVLHARPALGAGLDVIDPPGDLVETFHGAQPIAERRVRHLPAGIGAVHLPEHRGGGVVVLHPPHALCRHVPEWREILARHHVKYAVNSPFGTV